MKSSTNNLKISVVFPVYNGAAWLPLSIPKVDDALKTAKIKHAEIIVVNDGSSDDTELVVKAIKTSYPLKIVNQQNSGRFLARKNGVLRALYDHILFVDTRLFIDKNALKYLVQNYDKKKDKVVWNSHVRIAKKGNVYARFWDAIAFVAWRKYFKNPRELSYGLKDFDYYPKGTGCFFAPKKLILDGNKWFEKNTKNLQTSNDDTLLIRYIAGKHNINLSPEYSSLYHARPNLELFSKQVFHRGKVFVDGFLRNDGNRFFWPLILFLLLSVTIPLALIFNPQYFLILIMLGFFLWFLELIIALLMGAPYKDAASLFLLSPIFAMFYSGGIWAAVLKIYIKDRLIRKGNRDTRAN